MSGKSYKRKNIQNTFRRKVLNLNVMESLDKLIDYCKKEKEKSDKEFLEYRKNRLWEIAEKVFGSITQEVLEMVEVDGDGYLRIKDTDYYLEHLYDRYFGANFFRIEDRKTGKVSSCFRSPGGFYSSFSEFIEKNEN